MRRSTELHLFARDMFAPWVAAVARAGEGRSDPGSRSKDGELFRILGARLSAKGAGRRVRFAGSRTGGTVGGPAELKMAPESIHSGNALGEEAGGVSILRDCLARARREVTVPIGSPVLSAISLEENPPTCLSRSAICVRRGSVARS
jgi:hypothetical protein